MEILIPFERCDMSGNRRARIRGAHGVYASTFIGAFGLS
jgi:hypothetical protein